MKTQPAAAVLLFWAVAHGTGYAQTAPERTDSQLAHAIEGRLFEAPGIDANAIDVDVTRGVATLGGEVANILANDRAARIAQLTRGISSVQNRLTVEDTGRPDASISADVFTAFSADPATDAWEIDIEVRGGAVTLTGPVQSAAEKALATRVAKSVAGVRSIVNELQIDARARPDAEIEPEIKELLHWDVRLDDGLVRVDVKNGLAVLSGAVASAYEKELAIEHAWTSGATDVDASGLEVVWSRREEMQRRTSSEELGNEAVAAAVERAMKRDPRVDEFALRATAENGTVTVTGVVDNLQAKRAADEVARNVVGVERVLNYTKVRPELALTDEEIAEAAQAAIARDPIIAASGITLLVNHGMAKLYGVVDSPFERAHAGAVAAGINGVVEVENYLATHTSPSDTSADPFAGRITVE